MSDLETLVPGTNELNLTLPLCKGGLELVVLLPVLVRYTICPSPAHSDFLQTKTVDLFKNLDSAPHSSLYKGVGLCVVRSPPFADILSLLLDRLSKFTGFGVALLQSSLEVLLSGVLRQCLDGALDEALQLSDRRIGTLFKLDNQGFALSVGTLLDLTLGDF